jgi:tetratricopeptide (TPR) repeat protein
MPMGLRRSLIRAGALLGWLGLLWSTGCATPALHRARHDFYRGRVGDAERVLADSEPGNDRALVLMERGTVRQALGEFDASADDFIDAYEELVRLETVRLSQETASFVVNDAVRDFRGFPYERTLLHAMTALSHLARGDRESAAIEARRLLASLSPEKRGDYPEDAFSRYLAGFCFEALDDPSNATLQYRKAADLARGLSIDAETGFIRPAPSTNGAAAAIETALRPGPAAADLESEIVCFVLIGRGPSGGRIDAAPPSPLSAPYAELYAGGRRLGRSYPLADTHELALESTRKQAVGKAAKTVTRVVVKDAVADAVVEENEALGELLRFILIGLLERPDVRRWETLPRYFQVLRARGPSDPEDLEVVFRTPSGGSFLRRAPSAPLHRYRNIAFTFCRDLAPGPGPADL